MVGDYAQIRDSIDQDLVNILVIKVYPYKLFMTYVMPAKGHDPQVVER